MSSAVTLLAYCLMASYAVGPALVHAGWTTRAPRLAIAAWHLLCATTLIALMFAGLLLSLSLPYVGTTVASVVNLCTTTLQHVYAPPDRHTASIAAIFTLFLLPLRMGYVGARMTVQSRREGRRLQGLLEPIARSAPGCEGALVIPHREQYAFCFPGRRGRVIVTSALLEGLTRSQLRAVLAHERAHVRQRHHLALMAPKVLRTTFGMFLPLFKMAEGEVARLVELSADDAAKREVGAQALVGALQQMSRMPARSTVLSATAVAVEERLRRLDATTASSRLSPIQALTVGTAMIAIAITPFVFALVPVLSSAWRELCFIS